MGDQGDQQGVEMQTREPLKPIDKPAIGCDPGGWNGAVASWTRDGWTVGSWSKRALKSGDVFDCRKVVPNADRDAILTVFEARSVTEAIRSVLVGLTCQPGQLVSVEKVTVQRGKGSVVALAESAGECIGAIRSVVGHGSVKLSRPMPGRWREAILGTTSTTGAHEQAEAAIGAVLGREVPGRRVIVDLEIGWPIGVELNDHEADAICIALHGAGVMLGPIETR